MNLIALEMECNRLIRIRRAGDSSGAGGNSLLLLGSTREQGMPGKRRSLGRVHPCRPWTEYVRRWSRESLGFPKCWARVCVPGEGMLAYVWSAWSAASCVGRIHLRAEQFLLRR